MFDKSVLRNCVCDTLTAIGIGMIVYGLFQVGRGLRREYCKRVAREGFEKSARQMPWIYRLLMKQHKEK